ncbi:MAG TPA: DUF6088 family protein [Pyrinomonadaceae bacterium]|nr:DUF6088 family protein [Pyrinomonadaceae bacterium]
MTANLANTILKRVRAKGRGLAYTPKDFLDLGGRPAVDQALSRLARKGLIRRLMRGVYDYPKISPKLGPLSPSPQVLAKTLADRTNSKLQLTGAHAANALGLTTQVPAHVVYLTSGKSRRFRIGNQTIELRHASPRSMVGAGTPIGTIIQGLKYLGTDNIDARTIDKLKRALSANDKRALQKDIDAVPDWLRPVVAEIAALS